MTTAEQSVTQACGTGTLSAESSGQPPAPAESSSGHEVLTTREITRAIEVWMLREETRGAVICRPAGMIADVLGEMIWFRRDTVPRHAIKKETLELIDDALLDYTLSEISQYLSQTE